MARIHKVFDYSMCIYTKSLINIYINRQQLLILHNSKSILFISKLYNHLPSSYRENSMFSKVDFL